MKTDTRAKNFKSFLIEGVRIIAVPVLLMLPIIAVANAIGMTSGEPSWEYPTLATRVLDAVFIVIPFILVLLLGVVVVSIVLFYRNKKLTNISAIFLGVIVGTILVTIANIGFSFIFYYPYDFRALFSNLFHEVLWLFSPLNIATIVALAFATRRLNKVSVSAIAPNDFDDTKKVERIGLHGAWMAAKYAFIGCVILTVVFIIYTYATEYTVITKTSSWKFEFVFVSFLELGIALTITLPFTLVCGYMLGTVIQRAQNKGILTKTRAIVLGVLAGVLALAGALTIISNVFGSYSDPYLVGPYTLSLIIAVIVGAMVGNRLFSSNSDGKQE